jgi:hypothetical protein
MNEMGNAPSLERRLAGRLPHRLAVLEDERLEYWGDKFTFYRVREILGITFEAFLTGPEYFIEKTCLILRLALQSEGGKPFGRRHGDRARRRPGTGVVIVLPPRMGWETRLH